MTLPVTPFVGFLIFGFVDAVTWVNETENFQGRTLTLSLLQGDVHGIEDRNAGMKVFQGIPYAKPPVGNLRWRPTVPLESFEELGKGDDFQHLTICPQDKERVLIGKSIFPGFFVKIVR